MMSITKESIPFTTSETQQILTLFMLGRQIYAVPAEIVAQIIPMVTIMPLPQAHEAVRGVINVRGALTVVVNLPCMLGLPEHKLRLHTPILLVRYRNYTLGMIVDDVVDVIAVAGNEMEPSNHILPEALRNNTALVAMANTAKGTIFVLDVARLLGERQNEAIREAIENVATSNTTKVEEIPPVIANPDTPEKRASLETAPLLPPSHQTKASIKGGKKDEAEEKPPDQENLLVSSASEGNASDSAPNASQEQA